MTKPKLLLADDSVTIRKVVELTFADEGIDVSAVADAQSAMQRFVDIQPDIVLVDVGLDGTNGYQICEMIKADEATRQIPVLLLVGSFEPFDEAEAARVQANGHLTKPFHSIRDLVARVWELLGNRSSGGAEMPSEVVEESQLEADLPPVPTFGDEFTDDLPADATEQEPDDIEELYRSSFAETLEIEEGDSAKDVFGDSIMDDEMIQTSRIAPDAERSFADLSLNEPENTEIKEFDWSPESMVTSVSDADTETKPAPQPSDSGENKVFEPKFTFEDSESPDSEIEPSVSGSDDSVVETEEQSEKSEEEIWLAGTAAEPEYSAPDVANMETIEISHAPEMIGDYRFAPADRLNDEPEEDLQLFDDIDFTKSNAARSSGESTLELSPEPLSDGSAEQDVDEISSADEQDVDPAIHDTIPYEPGEQPPVQTMSPEPDNFSAELIERIAQRVIERLSDSAVREVAKEAVPRIAEKLIREALEHEKK